MRSRDATVDDMSAVRALFLGYQDWLGIDLCFQDFESELAVTWILLPASRRHIRCRG